MGMGRNENETKWEWDEMGMGRSGNGTKWVLDEVGIGRSGDGTKWGWDEMGIGRNGIGRTGIGRNGFGRSGNRSHKRMYCCTIHKKFLVGTGLDIYKCPPADGWWFLHCPGNNGKLPVEGNIFMLVQCLYVVF